jgi:hypothetical protein
MTRRAFNARYVHPVPVVLHRFAPICTDNMEMTVCSPKYGGKVLA